jgi:hypothetical protein
MTLPVGNLGTRFGEGKMAFETTRLYEKEQHVRSLLAFVSDITNRPASRASEARPARVALSHRGHGIGRSCLRICSFA